MELRTLTREELRRAYERDLCAAFPENELRPLSVLERLCDEGVYEPLAFFEKDVPVGYAFLWKDADGFLLFDYLAVSEAPAAAAAASVRNFCYRCWIASVPLRLFSVRWKALWEKMPRRMRSSAAVWRFMSETAL